MTETTDDACLGYHATMPRIPTSHNLPVKRPRAPVAADLDTANILPSERRRKRMKPARVTQME
jgi:hypothetical protein